MGITLFQRFSMNEASLFLRCPESDVADLVADGNLSFITVTESERQFFGYQLLEHLLENITGSRVPRISLDNAPERIIRAKEVQEMTGLSRTTLWRMENKGEIPRRVSLGANSVGWRFSEIQSWIDSRE